MSHPSTGKHSILRRAVAGAFGCAILLTAAPTIAQKKNGPVYREDIGDLKYTGPSWVRGQVQHFSVTAAGILIVYKNDAMPVNCRNAGSSWILLPERNTAMINLFTSAWDKGQRKFKIYADDYTGTPPANPYAERTDNYCTASKIDIE